VSYINQGLLVVGGATPDQYPTIGQPYSAYWIFSNYATTATVNAFMASDPYVANSLVRFSRISNYTVPNVNTGTAYSLVNPGIDAAYNTQPTLNVSVASPVKTFIALFYVYGPDIFTTRAPFRTAHLMNCNVYVNASLMVIGGAFPPTDAQPYGAMFVFNQNANATLISQFVANDPYVQNNLVVRCAPSPRRRRRGAARLCIMRAAPAHSLPRSPPRPLLPATSPATGRSLSSRRLWTRPPSPCSLRRRRRSPQARPPWPARRRRWWSARRLRLRRLPCSPSS
jgi:uncharacterized protein YciI